MSDAVKPVVTADAYEADLEAVDRASLFAARDAMAEILGQLDALLAGLTPEQYTRNPAGAVRGSVGPHVRHILDHVRVWLGAYASGALDYDVRERGTPVEYDLSTARGAIRDQLACLLALGSPEVSCASTPGRWTLTAQVTENGPRLTFGTTAARELAFVLSHTIHHHAILGIMARELGVTAPAKFGYAPATSTHLSSSGEGSTAR